MGLALEPVLPACFGGVHSFHWGTLGERYEKRGMEVMKKGHEVLKNPLSLATWMLDPEAYPGSKVLSGSLSAPGTACRLPQHSAVPAPLLAARLVRRDIQLQRACGGRRG